MPSREQIDAAIPKVAAVSIALLAPCPRCGAKKKPRCSFTEGKGYLLTLSCAAGCGWREVL